LLGEYFSVRKVDFNRLERLNKEDFTKDPAAIAAAEAIDISVECLAAAFALAVTFEGLLRDVDTPSEKRSI